MATKKKASGKKSAKRGAKSKTKNSALELKSAVQGTLGALRSARKQVKGLELLDVDTRKRLPKAREGAEEHVRLMEALLADRPDAVVVPGVVPGDLSAAWDRAEALAPLRAELAGFLQAVDDTILKNSSAAWKAALDILAVARGVARRDPTIREAIASTEAFLSTGPRKKEPEPA
ncbi:MAG: hypothetical protein AB2A00_12880 [Myxococcota bacterium]